MMHHVHKWGALHGKTLSPRLRTSREAEGLSWCSRKKKWSLAPHMWRFEWEETHMLFSYRSRDRGKTRWACLIIDAEKYSLFIIRPGYWAMTSHSHVPITHSALLSTWSTMHHRYVLMCSLSDCSPVVVAGFFTLSSSCLCFSLMEAEGPSCSVLKFHYSPRWLRFVCVCLFVCLFVI